MPVIIGAGVIIYSLLTDYEWGVTSTIPMRAHLALDVGAGLLLIVAPWLFRFAPVVFVPHVVLGLIILAIPS